MSTWHSYPKVYNVGHPAICGIFDGEVTVEEKVDGSQFSFGLIDGELLVRSKGRVFPVDAADGLFALACVTVSSLRAKLTPGWTYRGEVLARPRHNTLVYSRVPKGNVVLFDVETSPHVFLGREEKEAEADRLGLEVVPFHFAGVVTDPAMLEALRNGESFLGGCQPEGVVVKRYDRFTPDGYAMMGKFVRPAFKEVHRVEWKRTNPGRGDIIEAVIAAHATRERWRKAVQHLRERGSLQGAPQDIGPLIREVKADVRAECEATIKDALFNAFWPEVERGVTKGLPEWYKGELVEGAFR